MLSPILFSSPVVLSPAVLFSSPVVFSSGSGVGSGSVTGSVIENVIGSGASTSINSTSSSANFNKSSFNPVFIIFPSSIRTASVIGSLSFIVIIFPLKYCSI